MRRSRHGCGLREKKQLVNSRFVVHAYRRHTAGLSFSMLLPCVGVLFQEWADLAIVVVGEESYTEKPGDIDDLSLGEHAGINP